MNLRRHAADPNPDPVLEAALHAAYDVPVPVLSFTPPQPRHQPQPARWLSRHRRPAFGFAALTVLAAAILGSTALLGGGTGAVDAAQILARANAAASATGGAGSYHLVATNSNPGKDAQQTETWYLDATHVRIESRDGSTGTTIVTDGTQTWLALTQNGVTRVAHSPGTGPIAADTVSASDDPAALSTVLQEYGGDCGRVTQEGETSVLGRAAYRINVVPGAAADAATNPKCAAENQKYGKTDRGSLEVAVDKATYLPLRVQQLAPDGAAQFTYQVTELEVGSVDPSVFDYQAPAGATIIEADSGATNIPVLAGLKQAVTGGKPVPAPSKDGTGKSGARP